MQSIESGELEGVLVGVTESVFDWLNRDAKMDVSLIAGVLYRLPAPGESVVFRIDHARRTFCVKSKINAEPLRLPLELSLMLYFGCYRRIEQGV